MSTNISSAEIVARAAHLADSAARALEAAGGDLPAFYARVRALAKLDKEKRDSMVCGNP